MESESKRFNWHKSRLSEGRILSLKVYEFASDFIWINHHTLEGIFFGPKMWLASLLIQQQQTAHRTASDYSISYSPAI